MGFLKGWAFEVLFDQTCIFQGGDVPWIQFIGVFGFVFWDEGRESGEALEDALGGVLETRVGVGT